MNDKTTPPHNISLRRRFLSGASWAFSGKIISGSATLLGNALLARLLSPEDLGSYFLAFSIVSVFSLFCLWGLERGLVKMVAAELTAGRPELARSGIVMAFGLVIITSALMILLLASPVGQWILSAGFNSSLLASLSLMMGLWILIKAAQGLISESFRGFHDIRLATVFGGLVTAVISTLLYLAVWGYQGRATLDQAIQLTMLAAGISLVSGMFFLFRRVRMLERNGDMPLSKIVRFGFPLMITSVSLFGVRELHLWLLAAFQPKAEVALYGSALRLVNLLVLPLTVVNAVIPPMVADLYSKNNFTRLQTILQKTATLMSVPAFIAFGLILLFGADILDIVYGEPYRLAFVPFVILAGGQLINILTGSPGILLTMSGNERVVMRSTLMGGAIGVAVTLLGAQAFGAIGASVGFSVGLVLVNIAMCMHSYRRLSIRTYGNIRILLRMLRKFRTRIESDGVNGGTFSTLDRIAQKFEDSLWHLRRYQIIECLGDSHVAAFRGLNHKPWIRNLRFRSIPVRGATAYGIGNPNSKTNALKIFEDRLRKIPKNRIVLFMMGEVDVGFLIWLRAEKGGIDPIDCMEDTLHRYTDYLNAVKQKHHRLMLCSIPLPTIPDGMAHGNVANARREVTATQRERTAMTLEFNRRLKAWATASGVTFLDLDPYALDQNTMLVRDELLNKNTADHHYNDEAFHALIKNLIDKFN